jgi:FkbM family methyltransferase
MTNYSQFNQDLDVLSFYKNKKDGYFIEIGASDGIRFSNTCLLERKYNWKGICVEPVPEKYKLLLRNRPNSICYNNPIYDKTGENVEFAISRNGTMFSGIDKHLNAYKERVDKNKVIIKLKTLSFNDMLEKSNAPLFIDYLSIDTEGSEFNILKAIDFEKYTIGVIDVEHNNIKTMKQNINELLIMNGYVFLKQNGVDDIYIHNSLQ